MQSLEMASNTQLLSSVAGSRPAELLLQHFGGLAGVARASLDELRQLKGVGPARAAAIKSAFLLAQRLRQESYADLPLLDTPEKVADLLRDECQSQVERFHVVFLNTRRRCIGHQTLGTGILDQVLVHAREVFAPAIAKRASAIVLAHNHPSGDPTPSDADVRMTRDLTRAGQLLKIDVLDHVILGIRTENRSRDYCSLRELGYFTN